MTVDTAKQRALLAQLRVHVDCQRELMARMGIARDGQLVYRPSRATIKVARLSRNAQMPKYQSDGAACFDLHALDGGVVQTCGDGVTFRTGLAVEIPVGHVMLVYSRSGHGFGHGVRLANCTGVIDSDYRGELMVRLTSDGDHDFEVQAGDRVAQAMLLPIPAVELVEVQALSETTRGVKGFGSTGS